MVFLFSSQTFFNISMGIYLISSLGYFIFATSQHKKLGILSTSLLTVGLILHSAGLLFRWVETHQTGYGYIPLSNMYESLIFFSWTIVLVYLILEVRYGQKIIGLFVTPFAFLAIALTSIIPGINAKITPLVPALQSNWLTIHVTTCFFGYAAFTISFIICSIYIPILLLPDETESGWRLLRKWLWKLLLLSLFFPISTIIYLIQGKWKWVLLSVFAPISTTVVVIIYLIKGNWKWLPSLPVFDEISYKSIAIGFPMLTLGIITGAAWANYAWGSYWSWDPKETWSLITWFMYAAFLHVRFTRDWRGLKAAIFSVFGFYAVIFTYFGVNYLISGLHSYL